MPTVTMPDGTDVAFPDDMPPERIRGLIATKFPQQTAELKKGALSRAAEPITSYPETYQQMQRESRSMMSEGIEQAGQGGAGNIAMGVGKTALGGLGYVTSPINAALRTIVGKPVEDATGVPKEYTEFAASMALPIPKRLPMPAGKAASAVPTRGQLVADAKQGYDEVRATRASFDPELATALADDVRAQLRSKGAFEHLADPVHKTVDILRKDGPVSIDEVRSVQEALSGLKVDSDSKIRRAAGIASDEINQFLQRNEPGVAAILEKANANYAAGMRAKEIDQAADIAGLRAGRAGYGGNSVNTMRQVLSPIVEKAIKGNAKGFSPEEIRAMRDVVEGSTVTNTLRGVGQLSPSKGAIQTGIAIGTAGASAVVGAAANKLATILTSKQIDRLNELVRKRSPAYEEAVGKSADKYFKAAEEFAVSPSAATFARALVASRALSNGLTRDGIGVSSGDLLRLIQGTSKSGADEENPEPVRVLDN